jgi:solute:Na+ symporter, SSS family
MPEHVSFGTVNYIILGAYTLAMITVGLFFAGKQRSATEFFLAGRRLPWIAVAMSMYASVTSAMTFIGLPGMAYDQNISLLVVCLMSPLIAPVLIYFFYPMYRRLRITTSYEYISLRFGQNARIAVAGLFIVARLSWLGTVIYAPALALHVTTGIPQGLAILIIGLISALYCVMGGLSAVVWTDVIQFIIMMAGAAWIAILLVFMVPGGVAGIIHEGHMADKLMIFDWTFKPGHMTALAVAISYFFILLQDYGVDQVTVQRLLAVEHDRGVSKAIVFNAVVDFLIIGTLLFIGLGMFVYFNQHPGQLPDNISPDRILPWFILHQMPVGVSGLIIAALFAAAMSSVDSGLNSITTVLLTDVTGPLRGNASGNEYSVATARTITGILGLLSTAVALFVYQYIGGIIKAFYTFMGLFSAPVLALFLLGMLTKRANAAGWFIATAISVAVIVAFQRTGTVHEIYFFPLSAILTVLLGYLFSLFFKSTASNPAFTWKNIVRP